MMPVSSGFASFEWLRPGYDAFFKSQQMCDALMEAAQIPADECRAHIQANAHSKLDAEVTVATRVLTHKAIATIWPYGSIERAIAAKHGIHD